MKGPWWLVRQGRLEDARSQLRRLAQTDYYTEEKLNQTVALMVHTNEMEKQESRGYGFRDCVRGSNLRRTEIVSVRYLHKTRHSHQSQLCVTWAVQYWCGQPVTNYITQLSVSKDLQARPLHLTV